jgi:hypothetical protein
MCDATTWQDWVLLGGTVIAALAAAGAVFYAWRTFAEAGKLRRSTRSDRILDCIADYSDVLIGALHQTHVATNRAHIAAARLKLVAAIDAVETPYPKCRALINAGTINESSDPEVVIAHVEAALEEVSAQHRAN